MFQRVLSNIPKFQHLRQATAAVPKHINTFDAPIQHSPDLVSSNVTLLITTKQFSSSTSVKQESVQPRSISKKRNQNSSVCIKEATVVKDKPFLEIEWHQEKEERSPLSLYPFVWLRDNCQCENCFHPISGSRTFQFNDLRVDVKPTRTLLNEDQTRIEIEWDDGHVSSYDAKWLNERAFEKNRHELREQFYRLPQVRWGSELLENLPSANFHDLMIEDEALLSWLNQLEMYGFVAIKNAPEEYGQVRRLADRVAFIKSTHYGAEFSVKAKPEPSNVAYLSGPLQLHTDLPYYEYKPGVQFIHCIVQYKGIGGESLITDASYVAMEMKKQNLQFFECLSTINVDWYDIGTDEGREFCKILRKPVLCLDSNGEIIRVNYSHPQRDSFFSVDVDSVDLWYKAMRTFHQMLYDPRYCIRFKMTPGTIQTFDNLRIVHGRTEYTSGPGEREIEGCYVDWDEVRSRRRVLQRKMEESADQS